MTTTVSGSNLADYILFNTTPPRLNIFTVGKLLQSLITHLYSCFRIFKEPVLFHAVDSQNTQAHSLATITLLDHTFLLIVLCLLFLSFNQAKQLISLLQPWAFYFIMQTS